MGALTILTTESLGLRFQPPQLWILCFAACQPSVKQPNFHLQRNQKIISVKQNNAPRTKSFSPKSVCNLRETFSLVSLQGALSNDPQQLALQVRLQDTFWRYLENREGKTCDNVGGYWLPPSLKPSLDLGTKNLRPRSKKHPTETSPHDMHQDGIPQKHVQLIQLIADHSNYLVCN